MARVWCDLHNNAADQRLDLFQINLCGVTPAMADTAPPALVTGGEGGSAESREFDTQHDFAKPTQQQQLQKTASQLPPTAER